MSKTTDLNRKVNLKQPTSADLVSAGFPVTNRYEATSSAGQTGPVRFKFFSGKWQCARLCKTQQLEPELPIRLFTNFPQVQPSVAVDILHHCLRYEVIDYVFG